MFKSLLLLLALLVVHSSADDFTCSEPITRVDASQGSLIIPRKGKSCGFVAQDNSQVFAIRIDDLKLRAGDSLTIKSVRTTTNFTFTPPFNAGYFFSGLTETQFMFSFRTTDESTTRTEFLQNKPVLPLDGDINNDFEVTPVSLKTITLSFTKTIANLVHVEVIGAKISNNPLGHILVKESSLDIPIEFQDNQIARIRTSPALESCSNTFADDKEQQHEITGPDAKDTSKKYKCVNIFKSTLPSPAHYQADFKNFIDLNSPTDKLTLSDGGSDSPMHISHSDAKSYVGQIVTFDGPYLLVIYESLLDSSKSQIQFRLTVELKAQGGILRKDGAITLPATGQVRYVLKPDPEKYALIELTKAPKLQGVSLNVSADGEIIAEFEDGFTLPPVVALNKLGQAMVLDFSGKSFDKLKDAINFKQVEKHCHATSTRFFHGFSVADTEGTCYWTISSKEPVAVNFDIVNLPTSKTCLQIRRLTDDKPFFHQCHLDQTLVLPSFNISQASVQVDLTKESRIQAALSPSQDQLVTLELNNSFSIISSGYPASYGIYPENSQYSLYSNKKVHVITPFDVDIRAGENLLINNNPLLEDVVIRNTTAIITLSRPKLPTDFGIHRGYKLTVFRFDQVDEADSNKTQLKSTDKLTSYLAKISFPSADKKTFGKMVSYNITFASTGSYQVAVYDDRSLAGRSVVSSTEMFHGTTTSDTLLISYSTSKPNTTLPIMTVDYLQVECGKSGHVCDSNTRCVPVEKLCKGVSYCKDLSDLKEVCSAGPAPEPKVIETGVGGITVFILCVLMLSLGIVVALYGPDLYRAFESRFRSGQYTTFSSTE